VNGPLVVVTGAAGAIGRGICDVLAQRGFQAVGIDCAGDPGPFMRLADITDVAATAATIAGIEPGAPLHGLVNCAAVGPLGTVPDTDEATFDEIMAVNIKGAFFASQAALRRMLPHSAGRIVNIGSGAGHGKANMAAYAASKAALHALTMSMARDHFDDHVLVNTVIPGGGGIASGISLARSGLDAQEYAALPHRGSAAGRPVTPTDVGEAVAFLMGEGASTISGTVVDVGCMAGQGGA
jgi:NAD(P)-dependent dehydrogenase (short-subunit alcohol dehydrogenase family)